MPQPKFDWFVYVADAVSLAASATATGNTTLQIAADAPFQIQFITVTILQSNVVTVTWGGRLTVTWSQEGRLLSNIAMPAHAILLNGTSPYELKPYRLIPSNSSIIINWANSAAATATVCQIAFHGNKVRA
jgi:hypothetical protein